MNYLAAVIASIALGIAGTPLEDQQRLELPAPAEPAALVQIPEPSTLALAALGLVGMGLCRRRRIDGGSH